MNRFAIAAFGFMVLVLTSLSVAQDSSFLTNKLVQEPGVELSDDVRRFGDPARGAVAFFKPELNCAKCHQANENGRRLGPNLAEKRDVTTQHLVESILHPSAKIKEGYETVTVQDLDGNLISGILIEQNETELVIDRIEQPDKPQQIPLDEIEDWKKTSLSTMPSGLANQLADRNEFLDLIAYLRRLADEGETAESELRPNNLTSLRPLPEYEARVDHRQLIGRLNKSSLKRGEEIFRLRCASCHGTATEEGSMPTSLRFVSGKFKRGSDPHSMYLTLTHGYGMMNAQRWMVPRQKYDVIHYIRETFLKKQNRSQYFEIEENYLAGLPQGDTLGPKPSLPRPWSDMDYGPSFNNTLEFGNDGTNIAQKGLTIRLDDGPGGVESGSHWLTYELDTMRVAGAWSDAFIDYNGIHFNGVHGRHPRVTGNIHFQNPTAPGFGHPTTQSFADDRVIGRDNKHYGPLAKNWAQFLGMYRFGKRVILKYRVGETEILESPGIEFGNQHTSFVRTLNLGARERELVVQVAKLSPADAKKISAVQGQLLLTRTGKLMDSSDQPLFDGSHFLESKSVDLSQGFEFSATIKTKSNGTLFAQTRDQQKWLANGQTLFLRNGRLVFDIGWVGEVAGQTRINDGTDHDVSVIWDAKTEQVTLRIDGKIDASRELAVNKPLQNAVFRLGYTNSDFPRQSLFQGDIKNVLIRQMRRRGKPRTYSARFNQSTTTTDTENENVLVFEKRALETTGSQNKQQSPAQLFHTEGIEGSKWSVSPQGDLRLTLPPGDAAAINIKATSLATIPNEKALKSLIQPPTSKINQSLQSLTKGGPTSWPQTFMTDWTTKETRNGFAVDVLKRPTDNPWKDRLRLTGIDFFQNGRDAIITSWDGTIWKVTGINREAGSQATWRKIAAGLFQPLGVKIVDEQIYVTCRDQLVRLHDLNGDEEIDWYENFNSDHQVTEHFHEFAMGLQVDEQGNFYYAKSARHALKAVVPHHGTLLKVSPDGRKTEIVANGFRAANGVCLNPDGSFIVTDQEGHWNPKNRINWVQPGGFYGNMFGYTDVTDSSDEAMDQPLCWITNAFDRSPSELLWVPKNHWGPLGGSLLNFSYGYGKIYVVPFESVGEQKQGGMCEFPISQFPTGVMRGRFHPEDGQLYCCGMFAWAGNQQQPGGMYRVRYTGEPVNLPVGLHATKDGLRVEMSDELDPNSVADPRNFKIKVWALKRTRNYGSKHYDERVLKVTRSSLMDDRKTIRLEVPDIAPTWCMEIVGAVQSPSGKTVRLKIHNTIHVLGAEKQAAKK